MYGVQCRNRSRFLLTGVLCVAATVARVKMSTKVFSTMNFLLNPFGNIQCCKIVNPYFIGTKCENNCSFSSNSSSSNFKISLLLFKTYSNLLLYMLSRHLSTEIDVLMTQFTTKSPRIEQCTLRIVKTQRYRVSRISSNHNDQICIYENLSDNSSSNGPAVREVYSLLRCTLLTCLLHFLFFGLISQYYTQTSK